MKDFFKKQKNRQAGFGLAEALVGVAIIGMIVTAVVSFNDLGVNKAFSSIEETQSSFLLAEGAEAMKSVRDQGWVNISSLSTTTAYYLVFESNVWKATTTEGVIDGFFTRKLFFSDVARDGSFNIASSGTWDTKSKKATVSVSWNTHGTSTSRVLSFYLTDLAS